MVHLTDGDTDFFDIVTGVLQGDTLAPYLFTIFLNHIFRNLIDLIKENYSSLKKKSKKQTIFCRNYKRLNVCWWSSPSRKYTWPSLIPAV